MRLQVLAAVMHQTDYSILEKMNIQTDAIVVNQCDKNNITSFDYKGNRIKWFSLAERGVGLSRNTAFMRADADIILFADDDITYKTGFSETVLNAFHENPQADIILFNFESLNPERPEIVVKKGHRVRWINCLKYGACRIAIRRNALSRAHVSFSLLFGGGAPYQAGEDNLFIISCLKAGLKVYASSYTIGTVAQENSTWFKGYTEKYYYDKGALFAAINSRFAKLLCLSDLARHKNYKNYGLTSVKAYAQMKKGIEGYGLLKTYDS